MMAKFLVVVGAWSAARVASSELLIVGLLTNNNEVLGPPLEF
jgi:hypothetical protein